MKNIRRRNVKTYYLHQSQKFSAFHHHQAAESKTGKMIRTVKVV